MQKIIMALVVFGSFIEALAAPNETEVMAPVHQFVDSFNKGDVTTAPAGCSDVTSIIDDFPRSAGTVQVLAQSGWTATKPSPRQMESPIW